MSSKAVDVTAKPTLREQYFTDRSGIALALALSVGRSALVTCQVASTWEDLLVGEPGMKSELAHSPRWREGKEEEEK